MRDRWLGAALEYAPHWIGHQMRVSDLPGCAMAVAHRGRIVLEAAFGHADLVRGIAPWSGRWWSHWGPLDAVPIGDKVVMANPALLDPFVDTIEIAVDGRRRGRIVEANAFANYGEPAGLVRGTSGRARALELGGVRLIPEAALAREAAKRFVQGKRAGARRRALRH